MNRGRHTIASRLMLILAATFISALSAKVGLAQSTSAPIAKATSLDALFDRLKTASDEYEAGKIEKEIGELWNQSGRPEIDAQFAQANFSFVEGKFQSALQILDEIVQRAPDWTEGWYMRATVHTILGLHSVAGAFDRCLADAERVLRLEPRHFDALRTMAACHEGKGEFPEALAAHRKALAFHPFLQGSLDMIPELGKKLPGTPY